MKVGYMIVYVADVGKTVEFYERAFGLERKFVHESDQYGEMATGDTALAFASYGLADSNIDGGVRKASRDEQPGNYEIALVTDDVEAAFEQAVGAGAVPAASPIQKPWGQTVAYVRDLDGTLVELASPIQQASD